MKGQTGRRQKACSSKPGTVSTLTSDELHQLERLARNPSAALGQMSEVTRAALISAGAIKQKNGSFSLTTEGKQALRRKRLAREEEQIFAAQHQIRAKVAEGESSRRRSGGASPDMNMSESPLLRLFMRKRADGTSYLSSCQLEAGERLRRDFERGALSPSLGIEWSRLEQGAGGKSNKGTGGQQDLSNAAYAARTRFRKALISVGDEFAGPLLDFCCFLKGLEEIEREKRWPARSGKQILAMALASLARHYGLEEEARGPRSSRIRQWGEEGYRPGL